MTWDLYFMNMFIRKWQEKEHTQEFLFASNDNIIKTLLPIIIRIIKNECNIDFLQDYFSNKKDYQNLIKAKNIMMKCDNNRIYTSNKWTPEYRDELIKNMETELL